MNEHVLDDEGLMAEVCKGRREALEPLVRRHATPLLTFLERMVGDRHRSEELFQEVFLAIWLHRRTYAFPRPFKPWLYGIAVNKCRTAMRRATLPTRTWEDYMTPSSSGSPVELAIATETAQLVASGVALLPPQQRTVMVLRIWQQLSYAEIADILDTTEGAVRSKCTTACTACASIWSPGWRKKINCKFQIENCKLQI